jgi:hypothetical protein
VERSSDLHEKIKIAGAVYKDKEKQENAHSASFLSPGGWILPKKANNVLMIPQERRHQKGREPIF